MHSSQFTMVCMAGWAEWDQVQPTQLHPPPPSPGWGGGQSEGQLWGWPSTLHAEGGWLWPGLLCLGRGGHLPQWGRCSGFLFLYFWLYGVPVEFFFLFFSTGLPKCMYESLYTTKRISLHIMLLQMVVLIKSRCFNVWGCYNICWGIVPQPRFVVLVILFPLREVFSVINFNTGIGY